MRFLNTNLKRSLDWCRVTFRLFSSVVHQGREICTVPWSRCSETEFHRPRKTESKQNVKTSVKLIGKSLANVLDTSCGVLAKTLQFGDSERVVNPTSLCRVINPCSERQGGIQSEWWLHAVVSASRCGTPPGSTFYCNIHTVKNIYFAKDSKSRVFSFSSCLNEERSSLTDWTRRFVHFCGWLYIK